MWFVGLQDEKGTSAGEGKRCQLIACFADLSVGCTIPPRLLVELSSACSLQRDVIESHAIDPTSEHVIKGATARAVDRAAAAGDVQHRVMYVGTTCPGPITMLQTRYVVVILRTAKEAAVVR